MTDPTPVGKLTDDELAAEVEAARQRQLDLAAELEARTAEQPEVRYFAHVGGERIELGQDVRKKHDPFKPLHTGREVDHWEAEQTVVTEIEGRPEPMTTRYVAVSTESLEDAAARLAKKLPEDVKPPDRTIIRTTSDQARSRARAGGTK
jgi:hypothetical protein